jgi:HlyD family secretion protein
MRNKLLAALAIIGIVAGFVSAYIFGIKNKPLSPAFNPPSNPYEKGIYANGIIESYQTSGENINIYPEVSGTVTKILVSEGEQVQPGVALLTLEDSVQRTTAEQLKAQAESAKEQISLAKANLKSLQDTFDKQEHSFELDPRSVSKDALDTAQNAVSVAAENFAVAQKQYAASLKAYQASDALLRKYVIKAPSNGTVLSLNMVVGSYISPQGAYDSYTGTQLPPIVMGLENSENYVAVRCYIDEILISRLPQPSKMRARMSVRGTNVTIPLEYVRAQPYVTPKIELSNQRTERVDVRVLPLVFRFAKPRDIALYPGQLVDVYIGE